MDKPQKVYCDESGTTGNNLLNPDQPYFSYASIAIDDDIAQACVEKVIKDFRVQGGELKAKNLLGFSKGRRAISYILECHHEKILVSIYHKKYSLACKLFEYIFEPPLAQANSFFYEVGFHKFIATLLYAHLKASARHAEIIFADFEKMMRRLDETSATSLFSVIDFPSMAPIFELVKEFCHYNRTAISEELGSLRASGDTGKWVLDLTDTALFSHLGTWGEKFDQIDVYCDKSGAANDFRKMLDVMIGRREKLYYNAFSDKEQPITFNLAKEISMVDSVHHPGIQLADVVAGTAIHAFQNPNDKQARDWMQYLLQCLHPMSVVPTTESVDMSTVSGQRNVWILHELVERSRYRKSLTEGIGEYIAGVTRRLERRGAFASGALSPFKIE
jgi:hypothetical protein